MICDKVFEFTEYSTDRNSTHRTQIRRVPSSNPGAVQTDWGSFRGFPQSLRQMLCLIYISTIYLIIIHKMHKSQILRYRSKHFKEDPKNDISVTQWFQSQGGTLLRHMDTNVGPTV